MVPLLMINQSSSLKDWLIVSTPLLWLSRSNLMLFGQWVLFSSMMQKHSGLHSIYWTPSTLRDSTMTSSMKSILSFLTFITHFSLTPQKTLALPSQTMVSYLVSKAKTTTLAFASLSISPSMIPSSREWCRLCQRASPMPHWIIRSSWRKTFSKLRLLRQSISMLLSILTDQISWWATRDRRSESSCYLKLQLWEIPFQQMVHRSLEWESSSKLMTAASN